MRARYRLPTMRVTEIFHSLQGEGTRRGRPCHFVRLTGCPLRCRWCDTVYAFEGGVEMDLDEIVSRLQPVATRLVCVTGGEPLAQAASLQLMRRLADEGFEVLLETSGALDASPVDPRVIRILDLKAPGSGESHRNLRRNFEGLRPSDEVKIVLADRADYEWARRALDDYDLSGRCAAVLFSPVHGELDPARLAQWILEDALDVTLQVQEHRRLWPDVDRGV